MCILTKSQGIRRWRIVVQLLLVATLVFSTFMGTVSDAKEEANEITSDRGIDKVMVFKLPEFFTSKKMDESAGLQGVADKLANMVSEYRGEPYTDMASNQVKIQVESQLEKMAETGIKVTVKELTSPLPPGYMQDGSYVGDYEVTLSRGDQTATTVLTYKQIGKMTESDVNLVASQVYIDEVFTLGDGEYVIRSYSLGEEGRSYIELTYDYTNKGTSRKSAYLDVIFHGLQMSDLLDDAYPGDDKYKSLEYVTPGETNEDCSVSFYYDHDLYSVMILIEDSETHDAVYLIVNLDADQTGLKETITTTGLLSDVADELDKVITEFVDDLYTTGAPDQVRLHLEYKLMAVGEEGVTVTVVESTAPDYRQNGLFEGEYNVTLTRGNEQVSVLTKYVQIKKEATTDPDGPATVEPIIDEGLLLLSDQLDNLVTEYTDQPFIASAPDQVKDHVELQVEAFGQAGIAVTVAEAIAPSYQQDGTFVGEYDVTLMRGQSQITLTLTYTQIKKQATTDPDGPATVEPIIDEGLLLLSDQLDNLVTEYTDQPIIASAPDQVKDHVELQVEAFGQAGIAVTVAEAIAPSYQQDGTFVGEYDVTLMRGQSQITLTLTYTQIKKASTGITIDPDTLDTSTENDRLADIAGRLTNIISEFKDQPYTTSASAQVKNQVESQLVNMGKTGITVTVREATLSGYRQDGSYAGDYEVTLSDGNAAATTILTYVQIQKMTMSESTMTASEVNFDQPFFIGDGEYTITDYCLMEPLGDGGIPYIVFSFDYTNNGDQMNSAWMDVTFHARQMGHDLDMVWELDDFDTTYKEIEPGETVYDCVVGFYLNRSEGDVMDRFEVMVLIEDLEGNNLAYKSFIIDDLELQSARWYLDNIVTNDSDTDYYTHIDVLDKNHAMYIHFSVEGGPPIGAQGAFISYTIYWPDGDSDDYYFEDKLLSGDYSYVCTWYSSPEYATPGTIGIDFYINGDYVGYYEIETY